MMNIQTNTLTSSLLVQNEFIVMDVMQFLIMYYFVKKRILNLFKTIAQTSDLVTSVFRKVEVFLLLIVLWG